jgi:hypothetical protein
MWGGWAQAGRGGRVVVVQTTLPSVGPGTLAHREDLKALGTDRERDFLLPQDDFYKKVEREKERKSPICLIIQKGRHPWLQPRHAHSLCVFEGPLCRLTMPLRPRAHPPPPPNTHTHAHTYIYNRRWP